MSGGTAFVYGTLMAPEVVKRLINRVPTFKPATLKGFVRYKVKDQVYPAIVPSAESAVQGKVITNLSAEELKVLDAYEADEYYRQTVKPVLEDGTEVTADVYIWKDKYRPLLVLEDWDYDVWRADHLKDWVSELQPDCAHPGTVA
mmetsp:Transcript_21917/g.47842  ORF Transcript_21917/g.47842 Transcript_21917/m.47842 type:complete len:145 (+) Transcript_21917:31-465(+)